MQAHQQVDLSDLTTPVLTEVQRNILAYTEAHPVDLDCDRMLAEAVAQAGAEDLADDGGLQERLAAYVRAIEDDTGLRQLTRRTLRQRIVRLLRNRLSLTDLPFLPLAEHDALMASAPYVAAMHDQYPEAIEEEVELLDLDLAAYVLEWHARVPSWRDTYLGLDHYRHYRYLRTVLQALTFLRGPQTWVLKSPQHAEQLGPLLATFPDATVAFTHRDPVAVIQSAATMMAYSDRLRRTSIEPQWLIEYWADRVHRLLSACVRDRDLVPADRSIDIGFHQLNGDEMSQLRALYELAGVDIPRRVDERFRSYIDANPRGKKGRIRYDLTGHFGVTPRELRSRFDFYFDRFDVRPEDL
ncbi:MAG: sulfotransferase [Mycobacteriaceae bacterium]|nr:sulfotransferase [Mycobacteriaceae bacterium]